MHRVALTGGIATGKSHVRAEFERLGVPTIDADAIARAVVAPGSPGLAAVTSRFGREVLDANGALDRKKLASIVFAQPDARRDLERIIHPQVRQAIDAWFASLDPNRPFAIADIPLLYETGREREFDAVIVITCEPAAQIRRLLARDGVTEAEALQRIAAQMPTEDKVRRTNYVIRTDGTFEDTNRQVRSIYDQLTIR